jgi:hypothetical protein
MSASRKLGVLGTFFFVYLLLGSREQPWNDARQLHQVAEALVDRGEINVQVRTAVQRGGKYYAAHPFLVSAIHVPGVAIHRALKKVWPQADQPIRAITSHLAPALLGALVCLLFVQLCLELQVGFAAATLASVVLGFSTMVAVYARSPWSEIVQTAAFLAFFIHVLRVAAVPSRRRCLWLGLCAGLLINTKLVFVLCLPGAAIFAGTRILRSHGWDRLLRSVGFASLGALPGLVMVLAYNYARTRSVFGTGYSVSEGNAFGELMRVGLWGYLFSPGKSVFLYNPPLILAALALPYALRARSSDWLKAAFLTAFPLVLLYSRLLFWNGDWCWGPRYILFLVPIALLPAVFAYEDFLQTARHRTMAILGGVFAAGLAVQVAGSSFYWDHFIRIAQDVQSQWLGKAVRSGAFWPDRGGACDPCFEDLHALNWLPPFSPIEGHWWLLRHKVRKSTWEQAAADAPWRRYTSLEINIARTFKAARPDWWGLDFLGPLRKGGKGWGTFLVLGLMASIVLWHDRFSFRRA